MSENKIRVVIPTDFSVQGEYAYIMVKNLSEKLAMEITFLHVLSVPDTVTLEPDGSVSTCGEIDVRYVEKQKEMAERKLAEIVAAHGDSIKTALVFGKPTTGIIDFAESNQFDMIVMGTKGASGVKERVVGSSAQVVARKSKVPVLSLMCDRSNFDLKKIVLVHNFEENGNQNLSLLNKFILSFDTEIHLLQIATGGDEAKIKENMATFAKNNGIAQFEMHIMKDADVESGVIHFNQMNNMDMVCVGTHGTGGFFHSSSAERLINHMYKPVISYRIQ